MIKASYADGKASISIICTNEKTMELLSGHAREIGGIMESNLGTPTTVLLDKRSRITWNRDRTDKTAGRKMQGTMKAEIRKSRRKTAWISCTGSGWDWSDKKTAAQI